MGRDRGAPPGADDPDGIQCERRRASESHTTGAQVEGKTSRPFRQSRLVSDDARLAAQLQEEVILCRISAAPLLRPSRTLHSMPRSCGLTSRIR